MSKGTDNATAHPWTILGCGYVGQRLARKLLSRGNPVLCTRRSSEGARQVADNVPGAQVQIYDLRSPQPLSVPPSSTLVVSAPPSQGAPSLEGRLASALAASVRIIYLSTTGVYAPGNGGLVDDDHPTAPISERGRKRLAVERAFIDQHGDSVALRIPGIYGPMRGVHQRLIQGNYRLIGAANTLVSRIHVDDLVEAICCLGDQITLHRKTFVVGDDEPTSARAHAMGIAKRLALPVPPTVDPSEVPAQVRAMMTADRLIVPKALRELGWRPKFPNWAAGLEQALTEEAESLSAS